MNYFVDLTKDRDQGLPLIRQNDMWDFIEVITTKSTSIPIKEILAIFDETPEIRNFYFFLPNQPSEIINDLLNSLEGRADKVVLTPNMDYLAELALRSFKVIFTQDREQIKSQQEAYQFFLPSEYSSDLYEFPEDDPRHWGDFEFETSQSDSSADATVS